MGKTPVIKQDSFSIRNIAYQGRLFQMRAVEINVNLTN